LTETLQLLAEVDSRRLYLEEGCKSLYEYGTTILGYSAEQFYRRQAAMRVMKELPEVTEKVVSSELNLTHLTQAKTFFQSKTKQDAPLSKAEKIKVLDLVQNKSARETEKLFATLNPAEVRTEKTRMVTDELIELRFTVSAKLMEKLARFKELDSHVNASPNYALLLERLVDLALAQKEKKLTPKAAPSTSPPVVSFSTPQKISALQKNSSNRMRAIPINIKRLVWIRDQGCCTFMDPITEARCKSRHRIQYDHIIPFAKSGEHQVENLRLLCQTHNLLMAAQAFGKNKIRGYQEKHFYL
jgi:hypothetical protein